MMKKIINGLKLISLLSLFVLICSVRLNAQNFRGQVFDSKTKETIPYVNIGIPNKGYGTVSDENGNFSIELDDKYNNDSLKITMISYNPVFVKVLDVKNNNVNMPAKFYLEEGSYNLNEVVIRPIKYKSSIIGNKDLGQPCVSFIGDTAKSNENYEVGTLIRIKKQRTFIDNIKFGVCRNDFDSIIIRVNIYTKANDNVLKKPIYVTVKKEEKVVTIDTKKYNIEVEDDFIIAFEALEILQNNKGKGKKAGKQFSFSGGFFGSDMLMRKNIYDKWQKVPTVVVGFNATITYEDKGNWFTNIFR